MYVYTNETVASEAECVALVKAQYGDPSKNCQSCHLSCEEHDYERTVTTASWPSNKYWVRTSSTKKSRLQEIRQNFLRLTVHQKALARELSMPEEYITDYDVSKETQLFVQVRNN